MKLRKNFRLLTIPLRLAGQEIYKARASFLNPEKFRNGPPKSRLPKRYRPKQRKTRLHDKYIHRHIDGYTVILQPILRRRRIQARQAIWNLIKWYHQQYLPTYFRSKRKRKTLTHYRNVRLPNTIVVNGSSRHITTYQHDHKSLPDTDNNP
jgi:hypothetical protein